MGAGELALEKARRRERKEVANGISKGKLLYWIQKATFYRK